MTLLLSVIVFRNGKFIETGNRFWFPDDVTIGYIIGKSHSFIKYTIGYQTKNEVSKTNINTFTEFILGEKLTIVPGFHSHLESMKSIPWNKLDQQITFSYIYPPGGITGNNEDSENLVNVPGPFSKDVDPTRYVKCILHLM